MNYIEQKFEIPELSGISTQTIEEHLKLYSGYVKNVNTIGELIKNISTHDDYSVKEARRRLAFEFDGMKNHEYYFSAFEGGAQALSKESALSAAFNTIGGFDIWKKYVIESLAQTRGIGWAMLGYDRKTEQLISYWVDEQHLGQLTGVEPIIALDMWEHSYCMDYPPSQKGKYVEAFFSNLNWSVIEKHFQNIKG